MRDKAKVQAYNRVYYEAHREEVNRKAREQRAANLLAGFCAL